MPQFTMKQIIESIDAGSLAHFTEDVLQRTQEDCIAHWTTGDGHSPRYYMNSGVPGSRQLASNEGLAEFISALRERAIHNTVYRPAHKTCEVVTCGGTCGRPAVAHLGGAWVCEGHREEAQLALDEFEFASQWPGGLLKSVAPRTLAEAGEEARVYAHHAGAGLQD